METPSEKKSSDKEESEDDKESTESEELEPKLKYIRITNDLKNILCKDAASCIAVHTKFICVGTHWGMIHLLDHQGNSIRNKELRAHTVAVNQISIDANGDFIASCSDDGKVFVYGLYTSENNQSLVIGRLVKCVAIDPNYYKSGSGRRFITGDERLVLHEKTFLSRIRSTELCEVGTEGGVQSIRWSIGGHLVAWASQIGVRVYDINARCSLGLIKWTRNSNLKQDKPRCNLCWKDSNTLLVGWIDTVRICNIRRRSPAEMALAPDWPQFVVEPISTFQTDFLICGIGPLDNQLIVLGFWREPEPPNKPMRPELHILEPRIEDYIDISTDRLSLRGYQEYLCTDYHLECLLEENRFVVVSPKDIVVASPLDADDRVEWLTDHCKFEAAMEAVMNCGKELRRNTPIKVGREYLNHLLFLQEYEEAGKLCSKILGRDKRLWEEDVFKFARVHQLRAISPYLPRGEDFRLDQTIYEMVLYEYLKMEPEGFLKMVKEWSPTLYNVPAVVNATLEHVLVSEENFKPVLLEALAILYSHDGKYDKALAMYLKLKHKGVFQLIHKHNLFSVIHDMIEGLMELDSEQAIGMLLEKERVPSDVVVNYLKNNKRFLYLYLDALEKKDMKVAGRKFHGLLVKLYADFAREKLLPLLRRSDHYPIQEALNICKDRCFYPEMVYLLGRIGNTKEALNLIIQKLGDIEQAIMFCKEHDDEDLWEDLINCSLSRPDFITFLLQMVGTYIDPRILVQRIPSDLQIPGLKNSLVKLMHDYKLQVSVQEGCQKILVSDYFNLHERLVAMQERAVSIDDDLYCGACHRKIIIKDLNQASNILVFYCHHSFHEECLPALEIENCIICSKQKPEQALSSYGTRLK